MNCLIIKVFAILSVGLVNIVLCDKVTVETNKGSVVGNVEDGHNTFFGVPYAKVDLDNPFGSNLPAPNFETPFNADNPSIMCPQLYSDEVGNIQCLTLNIYVPHTANTTNLQPILVYFFGGGFSKGKAEDYGGKYLVQHDIIVVTVNYRLGPYGFLCLDDPHVPGNQGLKDQIASLRWLRDNIGAFGGDASKITISGESYGGGAVDLHLYSNYETLFDKVIIQSGSIFARGFFMHPDHSTAIRIAHNLGNHVAKNTKEALEFLAKQDYTKVLNATRRIGVRLSVCKEKRFKGVESFITQDPFHVSKPQRVRNTAIMIGYNSKEDFGSYANKPENYYETSDIKNIFYRTLLVDFNFRKNELITLSGIIKTFYLGSKNVSSEVMLELSDFTSDYRVNYAAERSVNNFVEQGATPYKYLFSYIGDSPYLNMTGVGAIHTKELRYLWDMDKKLTTAEQKLMRDRMTMLWANFVKYGNPTPEATDLLPVSWTPVYGDNRPYMNIDVEMSMLDHVYQKRMAFWDLFWRSHEQKSIVYSRS